MPATSAVWALVVVLCTLSTTGLAQQAPGPAFEVASVRLHTSDDPGTMMVVQPGGRFLAVNVPLRMVIRAAFQLQDDQIVGAPDWIERARFDIDARAAGVKGAPGPELLGMLQSLLADRFKLTTHRETRQLLVFALERARADGQLGPELRATACPDLAVDLAQAKPCTNISTGRGLLSIRGIPLQAFAEYLAPNVNRVVVNRTGLDGRYDAVLRWTPDAPTVTTGPAQAPPIGAERPSLVTAIQEQLGLQLTPTSAAVEVLVIDTLEHPTPN
jgi:uncharacterized protein (TIGR03435 family)